MKITIERVEKVGEIEVKTTAAVDGTWDEVASLVAMFDHDGAGQAYARFIAETLKGLEV